MIKMSKELIKDLRFTLRKLDKSMKEENQTKVKINTNKAERILTNRINNEIINMIPEIMDNIHENLENKNKRIKQEKKKFLMRLKERGRI